MRVSLCLVPCLVAACYSTHDGELAGRGFSPDAGACSRRALSTDEMLGSAFHVVHANCEGRVSELTIQFGRGSGARSSGTIEILDAIPAYAPRLEARPVEVSRLSCWIDASSRFDVSRRPGLELWMQCTDGVERRAQLLLHESCEGLSAEMDVSPSDPFREWTHGCYGADWSRR